MLVREIQRAVRRGDELQAIARIAEGVVTLYVGGDPLTKARTRQPRVWKTLDALVRGAAGGWRRGDRVASSAHR